MEDIEKELGPLLDNYNQKYEEEKGNKEKEKQDSDDFKTAFRKLIENTIKPEMEKYKEFLKKKGLSASIIVEPEYPSEIKDPKISFTFAYKHISRSQTSHPSISFSASDNKITKYEMNYEPTGSGSSGDRGNYDIDQVTPSFVHKILNDFLKGLFSKEWKSYDFE